MTVITSGLAAGEKVVTEGLGKVRPGSPVAVKSDKDGERGQ